MIFAVQKNKKASMLPRDSHCMGAIHLRAFFEGNFEISAPHLFFFFILFLTVTMGIVLCGSVRLLQGINIFIHYCEPLNKSSFYLKQTVDDKL